MKMNLFGIISLNGWNSNNICKFESLQKGKIFLFLLETL